MKRFICSLSFVALLSTFAAAQEAYLAVRNTGNVPVVLNWIDFQGQEQTYHTIAPQQQAMQPTYLGHQWRVRVAGTNEVLSNVTMNSYLQGVGVAKYVYERPVKRHGWCGNELPLRPQGGTLPMPGPIGQSVGTQPVQPVGSLPNQPIGSQPQQPVGSQPGQPIGSQPQQPVGSQPQQPVGTQPVQPVGSQPEQPTGPVGGFGGLG